MTVAPTVAPTPLPTICTNVTAANGGYPSYDDDALVTLWCNSRDLSYEDAAYIFLALLAFIILIIYAIYRLLKMLIDKIESELQYVKWSEDKNEPFRQKYGYGSEWCFVMRVVYEDSYIKRNKMKKISDAQKKFSHKQLITELTDAGFETRMHYNLAHDRVFIKVRLGPDPMKDFADEIDYKMLLNSSKLRAKLEKGKKEDGEWKWLPINLVDPLGLVKYEHTDFIYGKYDSSPDLQDLYKQGSAQIFPGVDRIRLIMAKLEASTEKGGCGFSLRKLTNGKKEDDRIVVASFPLHDYRALQDLKRDWLNLFSWPHKQPFDKIKGYFGTKVALYYVWLGKYTTWLFYASFMGLIAYCGVIDDGGDYDSPLVAIFAFFMCIWVTLFMESWKNTQERKKQKWGTFGMEEEEQERPEYKSMKWIGSCGGFGDTEVVDEDHSEYGKRGSKINENHPKWGKNEGIIVNPRNGEDIFYFPEDLMIRLQRESSAVLFLCVASVVFVTFCIVALKLFVADNNSSIGSPENLLHSPSQYKIEKWATKDGTDDESAAVSCHGQLSGCTYFSFTNNDKKWQKGGNWILAGFNFGSLAVGFANAIAIMIMSDAFKGVARHLNERENHRTDTMFEDALIAKSFLFNFVNSFFNLMFTAFIVINFKGITSKFCGPELDCMVQVSNSLMSLMMTKLVVGNIKEVSRCELFSFTAEGSRVSHAHFDFSLSIFIYAQVVVPYFKQRKAEKEAAEEAKRGKSADEKFMMEPATSVEEQYAVLEPYDILFDLFEDYLEMIIQFGYCTLFSAAFVFAPMLGFVNNYIEIRVDGWKMTTLCQRIYPKPAEDIGTWQSVRFPGLASWPSTCLAN